MLSLSLALVDVVDEHVSLILRAGLADRHAVLVPQVYVCPLLHQETRHSQEHGYRVQRQSAQLIVYLQANTEHLMQPYIEETVI